MAQRSFSVVVLPDDWDGSLEELAQKMMPVTRRGPNQVLPLLARGAMTLEADLSVEEAGLLQARLNKLGVPARVVDEAGEVVADSAHAAAGTAKSPKEKPTDGPKLKLPKPKLPKPESKSKPPSEAAKRGKWGSVFPDIDDAEQDQAGRDHHGQDDHGQDDHGQDPSSQHDKPKSLDELAGDSIGGFGAEPAPKPKPEQEVQAPIEVQAQAPSPRPQEPAPRPAGFDAGKMSDALRSSSGDKPPYAPEGFDDSMTHIPALAAVLSLLAPGAGQIYNGQDEQAREFGVRFALIKPWYNSVRQAYEYAEKIRTYWAPLPDRGALTAAAKYMVIWWAVAGAVVAALGWSGTQLYDVAKTPQAPKITEADIESAFDEARSQVQIARIGGLDGVSAYLDERDRNHKRFTMSKAERAQRLFRRGLTFCKEGNYATCESAMKRVSNLSPKLRRDAYRLQAWASVQQSSERGDEPMPDVGGVGTLADYEQREPKADVGGDAQPDEPSAKDEPTDNPR